MFKLFRNLLSGGIAAPAPHASSSQDQSPGAERPIADYQRVEVERSPFFKPEERERVLRHLNGEQSLTKTENPLSVAEKKQHGLNTRLALTKELVEVLSAEGLALSYPKLALEIVHAKAVHAKSRVDTVAKSRRLGVTQYKLRGVSEVGDCDWCARHSGKTFGEDVIEQIAMHCHCEPYSRAYIEPQLDDLI